MADHLEIGDTVEVICRDRASISEIEFVKFVGTLKSKFNYILKDGKDNWFYEIRGPKGEWFLYKPLLDGGRITKINH